MYFGPFGVNLPVLAVFGRFYVLLPCMIVQDVFWEKVLLSDYQIVSYNTFLTCNNIVTFLKIKCLIFSVLTFF